MVWGKQTLRVPGRFVPKLILGLGSGQGLGTRLQAKPCFAGEYNDAQSLQNN
jgi:hypothetical protein